jgi:uncharacterized protein (TIGR04255 family)
MGAYRHYPKAPITEAIIDLRVEPRSDVRLEDLQRARAGIEEQYSREERLFEAVGMVTVKAGVSATASAEQKQSGFKFPSHDQKYIWQSRWNGFTLSRLEPYESWDPFRDEARRIWKMYREATRPTSIQRLAVRYINRVDVPAGRVDLKDYFRTSPEVSPELPQQLSGFFLQLRIPQDDLSGEVLINQTTIAPARDGVVSVVLDVDLFRSEDVPQDEREIWEYFERLHDRKNEIFEACITDRARELFN